MSQDAALDSWVGNTPVWSFQRLFTPAETHEFTHGIHPYPAKMVPQIARAVIDRYSGKGEPILDPFSGSGTVLIEALVNERGCVGVETNP